MEGFDNIPDVEVEVKDPPPQKEIKIEIQHESNVDYSDLDSNDEDEVDCSDLVNTSEEIDISDLSSNTDPDLGSSLSSKSDDLDIDEPESDLEPVNFDLGSSLSSTPVVDEPESDTEPAEFDLDYSLSSESSNDLDKNEPEVDWEPAEFDLDYISSSELNDLDEDEPEDDLESAEFDLDYSLTSESESDYLDKDGLEDDLEPAEFEIDYSLASETEKNTDPAVSKIDDKVMCETDSVMITYFPEGMDLSETELIFAMGSFYENISESDKAMKEAVDVLINELISVFDDTKIGSDNFFSIEIIKSALKTWVFDNGVKWSRSPRLLESIDLQLLKYYKNKTSISTFYSSYSGYAGIEDTSYKCNIFIAEVIYNATGKFFHTIPEKINILYTLRNTGKYFPPQASQWADAKTEIPYFEIVEGSYEIGDIWSNGTHVGIFLGEYNDLPLYISARTNAEGVHGIGNIQPSEGVQIKQMPIDYATGTFRRYTNGWIPNN